jgi:putative ABC transport system permease protein
VAKRVAAALAGGLAAGLIGSVFLGRALESLLFGIQPMDPLTLASVVAALGIAAAIACLVPIRRAIKVDPVEALRGE